MQKYKLICLLVIVFCSKIALAQDSATIMKFLKGENVQTYFFENPDSSFVLLEDASGYLCSKWNAAIKYSVLPFSFTDFLKDVRKKTSEKKLLDSFFVKNTQPNNNGCFVMIEEFEAPKESNSENYILVICIADVKTDYAVMVAGSYPASKDALLRKNFIKSALSLRLKE